MILKNKNSFHTKFTACLMLIFSGILIADCRSFAAIDIKKNEAPRLLNIQDKSAQIETKRFLDRSEFAGLQEGRLYKEVRVLLIQQGWQPHALGEPPNLNSSAVSTLFELGYEEIKDCAGMGLGLCRFEFTNETGELLVVSATEAGSENGYCEYKLPILHSRRCLSRDGCCRYVRDLWCVTGN